MTTTTANLGLFKYVSGTDNNLAFSITSALNNNWDIIDTSVIKGTIIDFGTTSGTKSLTKNRVHKITANSTTTFSLPTGSTTEFCQMVVLLYMSSAYTINLGTSVYFGGNTPSMSSAGYYTIIYEYDAVRSSWVVGVLKKA